MTTEFNMNRKLLDDEDIEKMAEDIKQGFTSGYLNNEEGKRIYWELKFNVWKE